MKCGKFVQYFRKLDNSEKHFWEGLYAMKRFLLLLALVAIVAPALLLANPQDTVWVKQTNYSTTARIVFSPDSKYMAIGYMNASILDVLDGKELHSYPIQCDKGRIKWSKSGKYLIFGSKEAGEYDVVDTITWQIITKIKVQHERACITSDEKYIVTADPPNWPTRNTGIFQVWDLVNGNLIKTINETNCPDIKSFAKIVEFESSISPNEIYWISYNEGLKKLNIETNQVEMIYQNATGGSNFTVSSDGTLAAFEPTVSVDYNFGIIDLKQKNILLKIPGEKPYDVGMGTSGSSISIDNKYLAISNQDLNKCEIWDIPSNKLVSTVISVPFSRPLYGVQISPDRKYLGFLGKWTYLFDFEKTVNVEEKQNPLTTLHPNPGSDHFKIKISLESPDYIVIKIISEIGQTTELSKIFYNAGTYEIPVQINNFSSGNYVVQAFVGGKTYFYKLIITK